MLVRQSTAQIGALYRVAGQDHAAIGAAPGLSAADLAERPAWPPMRWSEVGTEPAIALLRRLAAAMDADVHLTAGHDLGSVRFEPHAA